MGRTLKELLAVFLILATGFVSGAVILNHAFKPLPPCGTGQPLDHCAPQPHPADEQRWDQGYLTEQSHEPCPAVYDAPNGELRECL